MENIDITTIRVAPNGERAGLAEEIRRGFAQAMPGQTSTEREEVVAGNGASTAPTAPLGQSLFRARPGAASDLGRRTHLFFKDK